MVVVASQARRLLPWPPPRRRPPRLFGLRPGARHQPGPLLPPPRAAAAAPSTSASSSSSSWSLPDDLFSDGLYDHSELAIPATTAIAGDTESKKHHRRPAHGPAGAHPAAAVVRELEEVRRDGGEAAAGGRGDGGGDESWVGVGGRE